jgi:hypothetical protein
VFVQLPLSGRAKLLLSRGATHASARRAARAAQWQQPRPPISLATAQIVAGCVFLLCSVASAADTKIDPVQSAKNALSSGSRFPWYDRKQDDVRRLSIVPRESPKDRGQKWTSAPQTTTTTSNPIQFPKLNVVSSTLQWLGLSLLIVLLGVIAYLIAVSFLRDEISEGGAERKIVQVRRDAERVEALPFKVRAATTDFLAEARRLYDAGQYSEAIIYLFSHELVELDKHQVIHLSKGKTNRQYLRETRSRPLIAGLLESTMVAFEDAFFGNKQLSRDVFEHSWSRLNEFEMELEKQPA